MDIISKSTKLNVKKIENIEKDNKIYKMIINNKRYIFKPAPKENGILMEDYNLDGYVAFFGSYFLEQYYNYLDRENKLSILGLANIDKETALVRL